MKSKTKKVAKISNKDLDTNKELKNFSDEELLSEIILRSGSNKGLPLKANCFLCHQSFWIKWNNATRSHSRLYNWEYLTDKSTKDRICGQCLRILWTNPSPTHQTYREEIPTPKRKILSAYLTTNRI